MNGRWCWYLGGARFWRILCFPVSCNFVLAAQLGLTSAPIPLGRETHRIVYCKTFQSLARDCITLFNTVFFFNLGRCCCRRWEAIDILSRERNGHMWFVYWFEWEILERGSGPDQCQWRIGHGEVDLRKVGMMRLSAQLDIEGMG